MKINKIFLVSIFILTIMSFGAVSATDNLTADNYDSLSTTDEMDLQTAADDAGVSEDDKPKGDVNIGDIDGEVFIRGDEVGFPVYYDDAVELTPQDFSFSIDGLDYNFIYDSVSNEVRFNTTDLSLNSHNYLLKFMGNDHYYSESSTGSFNIVEYALDIPDFAVCGNSGPQYITFTTSPSLVGSNFSVSLGDVTLSEKVTKDAYGPKGFVSFDLHDFNLSYGEQLVIAKIGGEIIENKTIYVDYDLYIGERYMKYGEDRFALSEMRGIDSSDFEVKINGSSYPIYVDKTSKSMSLYHKYARIPQLLKLGMNCKLGILV